MMAIRDHADGRAQEASKQTARDLNFEKFAAADIERGEIPDGGESDRSREGQDQIETKHGSEPAPDSEEDDQRQARQDYPDRALGQDRSSHRERGTSHDYPSVNDSRSAPLAWRHR